MDLWITTVCWLREMKTIHTCSRAPLATVLVGVTFFVVSFLRSPLCSDSSKSPPVLGKTNDRRELSVISRTPAERLAYVTKTKEVQEVMNQTRSASDVIRLLSDRPSSSHPPQLLTSSLRRMRTPQSEAIAKGWQLAVRFVFTIRDRYAYTRRVES